MFLLRILLIAAVCACISEARWIPLCESHGLSSGFLNSLSNEKRRELSSVFHPRSATKRELKEQLAELLADVPSELQVRQLVVEWPTDELHFLALIFSRKIVFNFC